VIHLAKLCVGVSSIDDLIAHRAVRAAAGEARADGNNWHRTRMMPKRRDELLAGGSLYWIISGQMCCRQKIVALEAGVRADGLSCCDIILDPQIVRTAPRARRPFQGWRYLKAKDAPADIDQSPGSGELSDEMAKQLSRLGLI